MLKEAYMQEKEPTVSNGIQIHKDPYEPPTLHVLGTVNELTRDWDVSLG